MARFYSTGEVSLLLGVSPATVGKWFDRGLLSGFRIPGGRDRRITETSLRHFCQSNGIDLFCDPRMILVVGLQNLPVAKHPMLAGRSVSYLPRGSDPVTALSVLRPSVVIFDESAGYQVFLDVMSHLQHQPETLRSSLIVLATEPAQWIGASRVLAAPASDAVVIAALCQVLQ